MKVIGVALALGEACPELVEGPVLSGVEGPVLAVTVSHRRHRHTVTGRVESRLPDPLDSAYLLPPG
jgi:hypothetical protein